MSQPPTSPRLIERVTTYSLIGLRLVDDLTGGPPLGRISAELQQGEAAAGPGPATWTSTTIRPLIVRNEVIAYPGLGRSSRPRETPVRRFRVVLAADYYLPKYPPGAGGFEFDVHPFNDEIPPAVVPPGLTPAFLLPRPGYPFPSDAPVLFGRVVDVHREPVPGATVSYSNLQTVLADGRGEFALPAGRVRPNHPFFVDAEAPDGRVGRVRLILDDRPIPGLTITVT